MEDGPQVTICYRDSAELEAQLPTLEAGGAFAANVSGIAEMELCTAVLVHPDSRARLELPAVVVWVADHGVGLQFRDFDSTILDRLREFVKADVEPASRGENLDSLPIQNINLEVRKLSATQRQHLARNGNRAERTALERAFGKVVWESLLRNPKITKPEVARIAQKGALPRPLLEMIVDSSAWLTSPQIRRTLLGNRALTRAMIGKVLRATPNAELKLVPKQSAYPIAVRDAAAKLLK